MEQARSCYSPGGAVMGNRRVPAQRLPIPDPFSRKEKQSRMSEAQVGINEGAKRRQMGPSEDLRPQQWPPEQCQRSRWKKRPYSTSPCQVLVPEMRKQMARSALQVYHLLGVLASASSSPGPFPPRMGGRRRLWAEGLDWVFGWVDAEHRFAGWFLHHEVIPGFNVLWIWHSVGEGSERWLVCLGNDGLI